MKRAGKSKKDWNVAQNPQYWGDGVKEEKWRIQVSNHSPNRVVSWRRILGHGDDITQSGGISGEVYPVFTGF